jgi:lipid-binding SYLF domain-containing protein
MMRNSAVDRLRSARSTFQVTIGGAVKQLLQQFGIAAMLMLSCVAVQADEYDDTIKVFKEAGQSGEFFKKSYGYAVFPTIGKAGVGIGGAHGKGRVYAGGKYVGDTTMNQLTAGFQLGGQAFSQIIFFEDKRSFDEFTSGNFEFGAQASAVAITAGASAGATTAGSSAGASGGKHDATTVGSYHKGMAIFTVAKGGLMYEATVGGQKFKYEPRAK